MKWAALHKFNRMKFLVEYTINNVDCSMEVEAADLETAKQAVNQWRVTKLRHTNNTIKITKIFECSILGASYYQHNQDN